MILIVDDDKSIRLTLGVVLKHAGYESLAVGSPDEAIDAVRSHQGIKLVILDMNFGRTTTGEEGIEMLRRLKVLRPEVPVILITAWGSIPLAVEGMRLGAFDFITKPWNNRLLLQRIATALSLNSQPTETAAGTPVFDRSEIIGNDPALVALLNTVERVAPTDAPVLILGENGTGKELVARAIHNNSPRRNANMVMVNLGGISQSLFESEMFGHVKGAYTGAGTDRKGRFEMADKGTIFLDEIGDLDLPCQVKLLRVLQQHSFERLGESTPRNVDIRVVAATNANLNAMVAERTFREDLLYRINLITLRLPPLRERRGDIPLLVNRFAEQFAAASRLRKPEITSDALEYLSRLPYPGNIRELKNLVERTLLISQGSRLTAHDFDANRTEAPAATATPQSTPPDIPEGAMPRLEAMERDTISQSMLRNKGNISKVAAELGITRQTLYRKLDKYNLPR